MQSRRTSQRYRTVDGKKLIEVRIRSVLQLFDSRDPAPFRERDLDDDFMEYIVGAADEISPAPFKIVILVEENSSPDLPEQAILQAIRSHIEYEIELKYMHRRKLFKTVRLFLGIGVIMMASFLGLAHFLDRFASEKPFVAALREGCVIFGWVALWRPFDAMLFDWYPAYDRIRSLRRVLDAEIEIRRSL